MKHYLYSLLAAALLTLQAAVLPALAADTDTENDAVAATFAPFQKLLDAFLIEQDLANDGLISAFNYTAALDDAATGELLSLQKEALASFDTATLKTRDQATAFWLNAYNFFMVQHILDTPRRGRLIDSVRDYGHLLNPYRVFGRSIFTIGMDQYSLSEMEKEILLGDEYKARGWKDARVHFAVNCASVGCPPLRSTIYTAENVDALLTENTRRALNTPYHLRRDGDTLLLTQLFEWYEDDYVEEEGSVRDWLLKHADEHARAKIKATSRIRFINYDWDLNRPENYPEIPN